MKKPCEACNGTGNVKDSSGHIDICETCYGIGTVEVDQELTATEVRRSNRFFLVAGVTVFFLGFYYIILYVAINTYGFSFFLTLLLFVGGHVAIFGGLLMYVVFRALKSGED